MEIAIQFEIIVVLAISVESAVNLESRQIINIPGSHCHLVQTASPCSSSRSTYGQHSLFPQSGLDILWAAEAVHHR
jgi:hypothetical protein